MNIAEIESKLKALSEQAYDAEEFPYGILEIYDTPRATVTKLRSGSMNKGELPGDVLWKGKLFFRPAPKGQAAKTVDALKASSATSKNRPRFLLATDGDEVSGLDTKSDESFHARFLELNEHFDFLLPLTGIERYQAAKENPADVKAAGRIAKFYDAILEENPGWKVPERRHALNLFMTRTLFCMFAEDTGIFEQDLFAKTVNEFTIEDGSDTHEVLKSVFDVMDRKSQDRAGFPSFAKAFPYVNGGLFREKTEVPRFSKKARRLLVEAAGLRWREINPDIFGSMLQAVVDVSLRGDLGMHYTSVPNIMKVIGPLFLDGLEKEFEACKDSPKRLEWLLTRIYRIRVFDPACGSGNFLIISYRELRRLEMRIFGRLQEISPQFVLPMSQVRLSQFYGIEYADFAAETAKLSLWISEYQANKEFEEVFGSAPPALPLKDSGNIVHGNALSRSWAEVCPPDRLAETYIVGNPPYLGSTYQTAEQKADMQSVFSRRAKNYKNLDYVACWFLRAADYCAEFGESAAFVSTNSICQGEQVQLLWPLIFARGIEIGFAHEAFKWRNNASQNAGVTCVIVGLRRTSDDPKFLFSGDRIRSVQNISPYLIDMPSIIVEKQSRPINGLNRMEWGNKPSDGGHLILTDEDRVSLLSEAPEAARFLKRYYGTKEFLDGFVRWCIWIEDAELKEAEKIPALSRRFKAVRKFRSDSTAAETRAFADVGHRFRQIQDYGKDALLVTSTSSETRHYIPAGFLGSDAIISNLAYAVYDAPPYLLAIVSSRLHYVWAKTVGGQLETRIRYTNTLVYNTFPVPDLSDKQKKTLEDCAWKIIEEREAHPGKTISELYDPETMPRGLLSAHQEVDVTLETIYRGRPFRNDSERIEHLFKLYAARKDKGSAMSRRAA